MQAKIATRVGVFAAFYAKRRGVGHVHVSGDSVALKLADERADVDAQVLRSFALAAA